MVFGRPLVARVFRPLPRRPTPSSAVERVVVDKHGNYVVDKHGNYLAFPVQQG